MQLSKRLQCIADYVTVGKRTADIGCDHGWVSIYLAKHKIAPAVIAMDVGKGPLQRAREHIRAYDMEDKIETRQSDGLAALMPGEVDAVVIAGMGGPLMIRILTEGWPVTALLDEMILSPQSELEDVRRFLAQNSWRILREEMILDEGKYYTIMKAVHGQAEEKTAADFRYGRHMIENKDPVLYQFLKKEREIKRSILQKIRGNDTSSSLERVCELKEELAVIQEAVDRTEGKSEVSTYEV